MNLLLKYFRAEILLITCLIFSYCCYSQDSTSILDRAIDLPDKFFAITNKKSYNYQHKLARKTEKYLQRLERREDQLKRKLYRKGRFADRQIFDNADSLYQSWQQQLKIPASRAGNLKEVYNGHLDSLRTALHFLEKYNLLGQSSAVKERISFAINKYDELQNTLNQSQKIQRLMESRQQYLKSQLQKLGFIKEFKAFQKEIYYYKQQVREYKQMFEQPNKLEARLMEILKHQRAFQHFFNKNSMLAGMVRLPGNEINDADLAGLQTRATVMREIENDFGGSSEARQAIREGIKQGQGELNSLKNKLNNISTGGLSNGDVALPDGFKPNSQKTKTFFRRIELGSNLQTVKANSYFPITTDIGLSAGYKLNDKSILGIGASYKIGLGRGFRDISITHEGLAFRSFLDWKIKGGFWISGSGEINYRSHFDNMSVTNELNNWQRSVLIGMSKKIVFGKLKSNVQLLYDLLWKMQIPKMQPVVFRVGYSLR